MGKNNWVAGEVGTVSRMNQPFYIASGTIAGGHLLLQIGPGRIRFPYLGLTVRADAQPLQINSVQANRFYSVFLLSTGSLTVSGHTAFTVAPDCPLPNGERIGMIATGASVSTANLVGPWNSDGGPHELRGEYFAVSPAVPRLMEEQRFPLGATAGAQLLTTARGSLPIDTDPTNGVAVAQVRVGQPLNTYPAVHGTVVWAPSGALVANGYMPSGLMHVGLAMAVVNGSAIEFLTVDQRQYVTPQNPDSAGPTHCQRVTSAFSAVLTTSGADDFATFALRLSANPNFGDAAAGGRIYGYSLIVEPGKARRPT